MIIKFSNGRHHPSWATQDKLSDIVFEVSSIKINPDALLLFNNDEVIEMQIFDESYYLDGVFYVTIEVMPELSDEINITHNFYQIKELSILNG